MKKEEQLKQAKSLAVTFLHIPMTETEYSPIAVQHPFFENERESNRKKEAEASSVEKTGYSEVMRTSGAQDRNAGIQSMCMEYQQTCI